MEFVFEPLGTRVVFGGGSATRLPDELERLVVRRVLVLSTPGGRARAEEVAAAARDCIAGFHDRAAMHVPVELARNAREEALRLGADGLVPVGGGSSLGLAKAIALEHPLPILAVPTTYSGSEMTPIWGLTEGGVKRTGRDRRVLARTVIYDPRLTDRLPPRVAGPSGMNALAHAVEALYARDASPAASLFAEESIRVLGRSLPRVVRGSDREARDEALYGACLAGWCLGVVGTSLHHKLCHVLGGRFDLPHAELHAVLLPHVVAFIGSSAPEAMERVARALGAPDAVRGLVELGLSLGVPGSLREIGMEEEHLDEAAALAVQSASFHSREVTREEIRKLLEGAFLGPSPA